MKILVTGYSLALFSIAPVNTSYAQRDDIGGFVEPDIIQQGPLSQGLPPDPPMDLRILGQHGLNAIMIEVDARKPRGLPVTGYTVWIGQGDFTYTYPDLKARPPTPINRDVWAGAESAIRKLTESGFTTEIGPASNLVWTKRERTIERTVNAARTFDFTIGKLRNSTNYCFAVQLKNRAGLSGLDDKVACGNTKTGIAKPIISAIDDNGSGDIVVRFDGFDNSATRYEVKVSSHLHHDFRMQRENNQIQTSQWKYFTIPKDPKLRMDSRGKRCFVLTAVREQTDTTVSASSDTFCTVLSPEIAPPAPTAEDDDNWRKRDVLMRRLQISQGAIPYSGRLEIRSAVVRKIVVPHASASMIVSFLKRGKTQADCGKQSATVQVNVPFGQDVELSSSQMMSLFGSTAPATPLQFAACITFGNPRPAATPTGILVRTWYEKNS